MLDQTSWGMAGSRNSADGGQARNFADRGKARNSADGGSPRNSADGVTYCPPARSSGYVTRRTPPPAIRVPAAWGNGPDAAWYVLSTDPSKEYRVRDRLDRESWSVWLPECVIVRQHKRYAGLVSRLKGPLFPGYLFVRLDMTVARWRILEDEDHRDAGIGRLLRLADKPQHVAEADIERLQLQAEKDGGAIVIKPGQYRPKLIVGERLRVIGGSFTGHDAVYDGDREKDEKPGERNIVIDFLGAPRVVGVAEAQVEPA